MRSRPGRSSPRSCSSARSRVRLLQGGRPAAAAPTAIDLARVREKHDQVRRADYFTILGIGRLCTPHEVREAAERLLAEFAPARFIGVREDGLPEALDEILRVVADAREVLADDRLRARVPRRPRRVSTHARGAALALMD